MCPRSPLLISIITLIWSLAQLPLYPLRFIAALLLTAQSIIGLSTLMLGIFFPLFSIVLGNVSHNTSSSPRRLVCWNDTSCSKLKQTANFWYRLWEDAGHPSSGVLFQIKKNTKTRYKYEIRRLKRRQNVLLQDKFASLFASKKKDDFRSQIRQLNRSRPSPASSVDNVSGDVNIANLFASKFANVLNSNSSSSRDSLHSSIQSSIESWHLRDVHFSVKEVLEALSLLKSKKTDSDGVSSDHLKLASSAIAKPLAIFLTSVVRHGYLPQCLSDCVLIPIPKGRKDPSCSLNYRAVALASTVSKVLEHLSSTSSRQICI